MHLCFYSDYLITSRGGGERHVLTIALSAATQHQVTIAVPDVDEERLMTLIEELAELVGTPLVSLNFRPCPPKTSSLLTRLRWFNQFDGVFWVCDGSLPLLLNRRRYLHIQIPFTHAQTSPLERAKLQLWSSHANANSLFTKRIIETNWQTRIPSVLWPVVDTDFPKKNPSNKKPLIVSIGRFFTHLHSKRQDVLIQAFAKLRAENSLFKSYQLVLIGDVEDPEYVASLKRRVTNLPVTFVHRATRQELKQYLSEATFYWHAAGFGIDEAQHPEQVEHFGISVAESMAAGCVPLVVGKGGMREVIGLNLFSQCSWSTIDECIYLTTNLAFDKKLYAQVVTLAQQQVQQFNQRAFDKRVSQYFSDSYYNKPTPLHE